MSVSGSIEAGPLLNKYENHSNDQAPSVSMKNFQINTEDLVK